MTVAAERTYQEFLASKRLVAPQVGPAAADLSVHPSLFPFQAALVRWAVRKGRCALFADTGLGKTRCQLEWARLLGERTLILAPLGVARQTVREGAAIDLDVTYARSQEQVTGAITVTNYEMLDHFDATAFGAVVLDESSILKSLSGSTRQKLTALFAQTPYRLACTATPAPNDIAEIANHAEFLGVMRRVDMLASFFVHDDEGWRLKGHAHEPFYRWLASWGMVVRMPSDIGYPDDGYVLPALTVEPLWVESGYAPEGHLFFTELKGIEDRAAVRRGTMRERVQRCLRLIQDSWSHGLGPTERATIQTTSDATMPPTASASSRQTVPGGTHDRPRNESADCNTTVNGTRSTVSSRSQSAPQSAPHVPLTSKNSGASSVMTTTCGTVNGSAPRLPLTTSDTQTKNDVTDSSLNTEWTSPDMSALWNSRMDGVLSAESSRLTCATDSTSTTTTAPEPSAGCYVSPATMDLGDSGMTPSDCGPPQHTWSAGRQKWLIWCGLNDEQDALAAALGDSCVSIYGTLSVDEKMRRESQWREGGVPVLVTKPSVMGWGMNWQHCARMVFLGLSDSYEAYYQCIRRCYRFGQQHPVHAYVVLSQMEDAIYHNVKRKEEEAQRMRTAVLEHVRDFEREELEAAAVERWECEQDEATGEGWRLLLGDSVERLGELATQSIDLTVTSPPFQALYTYNPTVRDVGNARSVEEFGRHFGFIIDHLLRVTKPGRHCCIHVAQVPAMLERDGYIGLKDFRGDVVRLFCERGFIYHGEVCIDKDPQVQAIRTKSKGLLFVQMRKDATWSRPALADYILIFRKPGENAVPVHPDISNEQWILWARPVWYDIAETDTLQYTTARDADDERHICPLQLGTIERCIRLWSNTGETVLDPFAGIASVPYVALAQGRQAVGIELKRSYYAVGTKNVRGAEEARHRPTLFDGLDGWSSASRTGGVAR